MSQHTSALAIETAGLVKTFGATRAVDGVDLAVPAEMGGNGGAGTNPEQLFAAGYAACFQSALYAVAGGRREPKPDLSDSRLTARVGIGPTGHGGFGLVVTLDLHAPRVAPVAWRALGQGTLPFLTGPPRQEKP